MMVKINIQQINDLIKQLSNISFEITYKNTTIRGNCMYLLGYIVGFSTSYVRMFLKEKRAIRMPPGSRLNTIARFLYSKRTYERIFQPTISDMQEEIFEALAHQNVWKSRWIWLRGSIAFWSAIMAQLPISATKTIVKIWKAAS